MVDEIRTLEDYLYDLITNDSEITLPVATDLINKGVTPPCILIQIPDSQDTDTAGQIGLSQAPVFIDVVMPKNKTAAYAVRSRIFDILHDQPAILNDFDIRLIRNRQTYRFTMEDNIVFHYVGSVYNAFVQPRT